MRRIFLTLLAVLGMAVLANTVKANEVDFYVVTVKSPTLTGTGTYQIYANVSQDNDGLSAFDIDVLMTGGDSVLANLGNQNSLKAPVEADPSQQYAGGSQTAFMGFQTFTSSGSGATGTQTRGGVAAAQDTTYGASDDPTYDMGVFVGVGQEAGSAAPVSNNGTQGPPFDGSNPTNAAASAWNFTPLTTNAFGQQFGGTLVFQGLFVSNGAGGTIKVGVGGGGTGFQETLNDAPPNSPWALGNGVSIASFGAPANGPGNIGGGIITGVPEPTSIGLVIIGLGMLGTGRNLRRKAA